MIVISRKVDLGRLCRVENMSGVTFTGEDGGHKFVITAMRDENKVNLTGSVTGRFIRPDGVGVQLTSSYAGIEDGNAWVSLPANCYTTAGPFGLVITYIESGTRTVIYSCTGYVRPGETSTVVDPENIVNVDAILGIIDDCERAVVAATIATNAADAAATGAVGNFAPAYSTSGTYEVGDYVTYNGNFYRCKTAISTAESWTAAHWTAVTAGGEIGNCNSIIDDVEHLRKTVKINSGYLHPKTLSANGAFNNTSNSKYYVILGSATDSDDSGYFNCNGLGGCTLTVTMNPTYTASINLFVCKAKPYYAADVLLSQTFTESGQVTLPSNAKYISIGVVSVSGTGSGIPNSQDSTSIEIEDILFREYLDTTLTEKNYAPSSKSVGDAITSAVSTATSDIPTMKTRINNANIAQLRINPNDFVNHNVNFVARTGRTNLFLGYGSGTNTVETDDGSGGDPQSGNFNVAVGYEAFNQNTTGNHCTAIGYTALKKNTSGKFNTAVGEDAMYSNTTGNYNVSIGTHSLQTNNGSYNVVVGADSVRHISDSTRNRCIVIGGFINLDADASNVIVIAEGHRNGSPDYTTISGSNKIVIGNSNHTSVMIAGKVINFNQDGTVTWSEPT